MPLHKFFTLIVTLSSDYFVLWYSQRGLFLPHCAFGKDAVLVRPAAIERLSQEGI